MVSVEKSHVSQPISHIYEVERGSVYSHHELEKNFSLFSTCAFQISLLASPLAIGAFLNTVIGVGGPPFLIYGFILAVTLDLVVCYCLAELASAYPHSSAQVHWTYCLAPAKYKRILSYTSGVLSSAGWIFACLSSTYVATVLIIALSQLYHDSFTPRNYHYYLVYAGIFITGFMLNAFAVHILPIMTKGLVGVINIGTLFIIIALLAKSPKQSASFVFKEVINDTGWSSNGLVFFLALLPSFASICLYDGAVHMTDEIVNPERNVPLVMVISNTFSAVFAFVAVIVYMFCVTSPSDLTNPVGGQPFVQLIYDSLQIDALIIIAVVLLIISFVGSSYLYYCSTSRLVWSFANSNALPFRDQLGSIHSRFKSPVWALLFVTVVCLALGTIMFGSASILSAVLGSSIVCVNISYLIPFACILYKTKLASSPLERFDTKVYFTLGRLGMPLNAVSCVWICLIMVWLCFPLTYPVTTSNMNYACAVLGITFLLSAALWVVHGRRNYKHNVESIH
ncbi:uncharacterized protein LODBEIA_P28130 [Lodderomyces beijingensis]|uniref:Amino acid transporter n=1 Tax=Lodderomyces beijingensis TaxID=1775926 RepID=A0ABP0ZKB1_9ASCO